MSIVRAPRTMSGRMASRMRFFSSGVARFAHSGFGTMPNIAPPSSRKKPSNSEMSSRLAERVPSDRARSQGTLVGGRWLVSRRLLELDEHAVRARRVDERDEPVFGARARRLVDEPRPALLQLRERGVDVVHPQRDVVQAGTALLHVLRDCGIRRCRLEKFELGLAHRDEMRAHALRCDFLGRFDLEAQGIAIERQRRRQILHGDSDVIQNGFHVRNGASRRHEGHEDTRSILVQKTRPPSCSSCLRGLRA